MGVSLNACAQLENSSAAVPSGSIAAWPTTTPPSGWVRCDGTSYSTSTYPNLSAAIGTIYGGGSGTFNVPNLQSMVCVGLNSGDGNFSGLGLTGGQAYVTLSANQIPGHQHGVSDPGHYHGTQEQNHQHQHSYQLAQVYNQGQQSKQGVYQYGNGTQNGNQGTTNIQSQTVQGQAYLSIQKSNAGLSMNQTGGGGNHLNLQPYFVLLYIIKT